MLTKSDIQTYSCLHLSAQSDTQLLMSNSNKMFLQCIKTFTHYPGAGRKLNSPPSPHLKCSNDALPGHCEVGPRPAARHID